MFFAWSDTVALAALGRFFMGIGSAFAFIGVLVVAGRWFPLQYFALLVGIAQFLAAIGAIGGEVPLVDAVNRIGWRDTTYWLVAMGFVLLLLIFAVVRDHPPSYKLENRVRKETGQYSLLKSLAMVVQAKQTWWVALYAFSAWAPIAAFASLWGVPFLIETYQIEKSQAALAIMMIWLGLAFTSPILGWYSNRLGRRCILLSFCAGIGFVCASIVIFISGVPFWLLCLLLFGFGMAAAGQILSFALVKDNNHKQVTATAIGFNNMAVVAGGALFQPLIGILLRLVWQGEFIDGVPWYTMNNYRVAMSVVPLCFLTGLLASRLFIKETYCQPKYS